MVEQDGVRTVRIAIIVIIHIYTPGTFCTVQSAVWMWRIHLFIAATTATAAQYSVS